MSQDPDLNADHPRRTKNKRVMVSTEENSLSDLLGAALPKGVLAGLPGLRGISSPDVPAFAAKPAIDAFNYGTATPAMDELREAALAYTHDEPNALSTQAPVTLELVADNGPADEKSTDTLAQEQLEAARAAAVMEIEEMIEQARLNGDDEGKMRLEAILNSVKGAKTISAISAAQSLTGQASGGKVETAEAKRAEAWRRIEQLNSDIQKDLYDLRTPEERERAKELAEELERRKKEEERILADPNATDAQKQAAIQARIDAYQAIKENDKRDINRIENEPTQPLTPEQQKKLEDAKRNDEKRDTLEGALLEGLPRNDLLAEPASDVKPREKHEKAAKINLMDSLSEQPALTVALGSPELSNRTDVTIAANATTETGKPQSIPAIAQALNNSGVVSQTTQAPTVEATQPEVQLANLTVTKPATGKSAGMFGA